MGLCLHLALGLRVSRLLDLEAVLRSKSDTPTRAKNCEDIILKCAETSMKTRIQETVGRRQENFKDRKNGIGKQE